MKYLFFFILVGCVGNQNEFYTLYEKYCGTAFNDYSPKFCGSKAFLPLLLSSQEPLVRENIEQLRSFLNNYSVEDLKVRSEHGESLWVEALKNGGESIYKDFVVRPGLEINSAEVTSVFYQHSPYMFGGVRNFAPLLISPSMELYLTGNGNNPHSVYPFGPADKDLVLKHLFQHKSLKQIANLFYYTNALADPDFVRDLSPYYAQAFPFPPLPNFTVSLGALVSRKWVYGQQKEYFADGLAFFDPLALAVFEGREIEDYVNFSNRSNALSVAYAMMDDKDYPLIKNFGLRPLKIFRANPWFVAHAGTDSKELQTLYLKKVQEQELSFKKLKTMIIAIQEGHYNVELIHYFINSLSTYIEEKGLYPAYNRYIGHELAPIMLQLRQFGFKKDIFFNKYEKHMRSVDLFGKGSV